MNILRPNNRGDVYHIKLRIIAFYDIRKNNNIIL